jgi:hypothetical protein
MDLLVSPEEEADEIIGSIPNVWFVLGHVKLCGQQ